MTTVKSLPLTGLVVFAIVLLSLFVSCPSGGPVQLTIQIWKGADLASVAKESESSMTINSSVSTPIAIDLLADHVFIRWEVISGGSVMIADTAKPKTSISISDNSTIKAVYLQAYQNPFNGHYYRAFN